MARPQIKLKDQLTGHYTVSIRLGHHEEAHHSTTIDMMSGEALHYALLAIGSMREMGNRTVDLTRIAIEKFDETARRIQFAVS